MRELYRFFIFVMIIILVTTFLYMPQTARGFHEIFEFPALLSQPLNVPAISPFTGDILVDNFEYWDSPYNHGWIQFEPAYPVYGFGMGYATIFNTVLDLQEGSRVLDVYRPHSIFLLSTPYERHQIFHGLFTPPTIKNPEGATGINTEDYSIISFDFRAPLGIEPWDIFELNVIGATVGKNAITIRIVPLQPLPGPF